MLLTRAKKDVILLAGKSTEPYQDMGTEKVPYDETMLAKRAIKEVEKNEDCHPER